MRDPVGELIGFTSILRDVTERRQMLDQLRDSEEAAQGTIRSALDAIIQMDESGISPNGIPERK